MDPFLTPTVRLPLLAAGQAQKEVAHNEALVLIDMLLAGRAVAAGVDTPPTAPEPGECWIVGTTPTGDWTGRARAVAGWTDGGWRFIVPWPGLTLRAGNAQTIFRYSGTAWTAAASIASPGGGTVVDIEARAAIASILAALVVHGLLTPA